MVVMSTLKEMEVSITCEGGRLNNAAMFTPRLIDRSCCMVRLQVQSITGQAEERCQVYARAHRGICCMSRLQAKERGS